MALTNATTLADYSSGIGTQGATLKVDANNQRVGIGTLTPAETLDVVGNMAVEGDISVTGTISYEDLTNVDSVGIITARSGIRVTGGSVGIGSDSPEFNLDFVATRPAIKLKSTATGDEAGQIRFLNNFDRVARIYQTSEAGNGSGALYIETDVRDIRFSTSSTERVRIDSVGRVAIGTVSAPNYTRLLLQGNNTDAGGEAVLRLCMGGNDPGSTESLGAITFSDSEQTSAAHIKGRRDSGTWTSGSSYPTYLEFATTSNGESSPTERLRITSSGQVLINSTETSASQNGKLKVRNDVDYSSTEFEDNATLCLQNETNSNFATILFHSNNSGGSSGRSIIAGGATGSALGEIHFWADASNDTSAASRDVRISPNNLYVYGSEGISAALNLVADEGDDNGDTWRLISNQDDNDLTISNNVSGSFADKLTIRNDGDVRINDGNLVISTSGHGIDFSATSDGSGTTTSELLDEYEEGTWTPTVGGTATYTQQEGRYTKIGRMVHLVGVLIIDTIGTGSQNIVSGLPFTNGTPGQATVNINYYSSSNATTTWIAGYVEPSTSNFRFSGNDGNATTADANINFLTTSTGIYFSLTYQV